MNEQSVFIPIHLIDPNPYQPREAMDPAAVQELADNIRRNTLLQVPSARQVDDRYQLAFGHRRLEAFKLNGAVEMPLIIRDLSDLQMFELGLAENIKRRDLNRIEEARAMRRYMDDFDKTSAEAAEFFSVSPEQVRATIRLLDLPPIAQEQLAAGSINIEHARMILSIQKVAPAETIAETVQLMSRGVDRFGKPATATEIVHDSIGRLDETVRMWNDNRDGKPRANMDYRGNEGWLLSMKNFPNKMLPELTPVDLAVALGIQDDEDLMNLAVIAMQWKRGELDGTQEEFDENKIPQEILEKIDHLLAPPACSACPFYTKIAGVHYCGMKTCHDRRTIAWKAEALRAAVKDLGIPEYDKKDGTYRVIAAYGNDEKLFTKRHKDLRLIKRDLVRGYHYQTGLAGVKDDSFLVVLTGETLKAEKADVREERAETKLVQDADALRIDLIHENRQRLNWAVALQVQTLFEGITDQAINTLWEAAYTWTMDIDDIPEEDQPKAEDGLDVYEQVRRPLIALAMIQEETTTDDRNMAKMTAYAERLADIIKPWKIRLPKKIANMAERMDQEIADQVAAVKASAKANGKKNGHKA